MHEYTDAIRNYRKASIAINKGLTPYMAVYSISFELGFALVLLAGGQWITYGTLDPSLYMMFLVLVVCFYDPLPLMDYAIYNRLNQTTIRNLNEIIQPADLTVPSASRQQTPAGYAIELQQVSFGYGESLVVKNLNLTIPERGVTALVGPSGGGKTTILNLIARYWDVTHGSVKIGGSSSKRDFHSYTTKLRPETNVDSVPMDMDAGLLYIYLFLIQKRTSNPPF